MKKVQFVIGVNFDGSPMIYTIWIPIINLNHMRN